MKRIIYGLILVSLVSCASHEGQKSPQIASAENDRFQGREWGGIGIR